MVELGLVDYFVMGEAVGIVATFVAAFYFSRKQMQKLSVDIETKVLSDVDEKMNDLTKIAVEKPQLIKRRNSIHVSSFAYICACISYATMNGLDGYVG
ncbi:MAG: hypothetical protein ACJ71P_08520 [Nitrososphaeraceae archaeon]|jgi:hypothetical protein